MDITRQEVLYALPAGFGNTIFNWLALRFDCRTFVSCQLIGTISPNFKQLAINSSTRTEGFLFLISSSKCFWYSCCGHQAPQPTPHASDFSSHPSSLPAAMLCHPSPSFLDELKPCNSLYFHIVILVAILVNS